MFYNNTIIKIVLLTILCGVVRVRGSVGLRDGTLPKRNQSSSTFIAGFLQKKLAFRVRINFVSENQRP